MPDFGPSVFFPSQQCPAPASSTGRPGTSSLRVRESCQACAISKVRCTKERPSCSKCLNRGIPCQYFLARRPGRRPERRGMAAGAGPVSDPAGSHQSAVRAAQQQTSLVNGFDADGAAAPLIFSEADSLHFTLFDAKVAEALPVDDLLAREMEVGSEMNTPFIQDNLTCDTFDYNLDEDSLWTLSTIETGDGSICTPQPCVQPPRSLEFELPSTLSQTTSDGDFLSTPSGASLLDPRHVQPLPHILGANGALGGMSCACFVRALEILKMPPAAQPRCCDASPGRYGATGADGSRDAIEAVSSGLRCLSCSQDSSFLMILAMIVLKVLDRYAIMGRPDGSGMAAPAEPQDPATMHWCSDDDSSRGSVGIEVGLAEIYHVQEVVRDLCRRINDLTKGGRDPQYHHTGGQSWGHGCGGMEGRSGCGGGEAGGLFSASTLQHIQLDLCRRLGYLSTEVANCLRET